MSAEFARVWPDAVRSFEFGRSAEGRIMRGLLISRSGALTPADLRAQAIPLLMIQGGIHPGESDGKDAGFAALRDLLGFLIGCPVGADCGAVRSGFQYGRARARRTLESPQSEWSGRDRLAHDGAKHQPQSRLHEGGHPGNARHVAPHRCMGSAGVRRPACHRRSGLRARHFASSRTAQSRRRKLESERAADAGCAHCAAHRTWVLGTRLLSRSGQHR